MTILNTLPDNAEEYFAFYRKRSREEVVKNGDLKLVLEELRRAYKQYPDRQHRISWMAKVITTGINAKPNQDKETAKLVNDLKNTLMKPPKPTVIELQKKYIR